MSIEKWRYIAAQQMDATKYDEVTCGCGQRLSTSVMYRCLYCGEWFCQKCAENHFGKTRAEYNRERMEEELAAAQLRDGAGGEGQ